jgi:hypothetical protein
MGLMHLRQTLGRPCPKRIRKPWWQPGFLVLRPVALRRALTSALPLTPSALAWVISSESEPRFRSGGRFICLTWTGIRLRECDEAGPGGPPRAVRLCPEDYQVPPDGHAPLPAVAHVRVTAPVAGSLVIVNVFPEDEVATIP